MASFLGPFASDDTLSDSRKKVLNVSQVEIDFSSPLGTYNLGENLQVNSTVLQILVKVETAFDDFPILTVGNTTSPDLWMDNFNVDLSVVGIYVGFGFDLIKTTTQCRVYWNPNGSSKGRLNVFLIFSDN